jgi:hypothetical protein
MCKFLLEHGADPDAIAAERGTDVLLYLGLPCMLKPARNATNYHEN